MSWLSDRTGIHLNLRPLAPIAGGALGGLLGGPAGAAWGSGLGRGLDDLAHGQNIGQSLKEGALTGGATYLGGKALQQLGGMFQPSSAPLPTNTQYTPGADGGWSGPPGTAFNAGAAAGGGAGAPPIGGGGGGAMDRLGSMLGNAGGWAAKNPNAIGGALQGLGNMAGASSENRLRNAQASQLEQTAMETEEQRKRDLARAQAFGPLAQSLMGQLQTMYGQNSAIRPDPYLTPGGGKP